ncbi:type II toxin-antitoxin system PemK/MazF family toxin [Salicibibacter cibarius]|uniref:Type II toxin-antitoxin system PemK/MazF family toxin n=1 Tax=Salicibibacter cibarius TaxID=2743000 RepID=A0A7T7CD46_9BACI|nr:type II toxin-antitoxin system PemK/MazF family toxin [Salicibibacter cibarius]QQK77614.1 type II toxin-antitoxin system PemK/MazF family toxin [Salicibibacter cibarius]
MRTVPEKGDLVYLNFHPQSGREQAGHRPAIILSPKSFNQVTDLAIVCQITKQKKGYPFEVELPKGLKIRGSILTDHVKSIDWQSRQIQIVEEAPQNVTETCIKRIHTFMYL